MEGMLLGKATSDASLGPQPTLMGTNPAISHLPSASNVCMGNAPKDDYWKLYYNRESMAKLQIHVTKDVRGSAVDARLDALSDHRTPPSVKLTTEPRGTYYKVREVGAV